MLEYNPPQSKANNAGQCAVKPTRQVLFCIWVMYVFLSSSSHIILSSIKLKQFKKIGLYSYIGPPKYIFFFYLVYNHYKNNTVSSDVNIILGLPNMNFACLVR